VPRPFEVGRNWGKLRVPEIEIWIPLDLDAKGFKGVSSEEYLWVRAQDWPADFEDTEKFWRNEFAGNAATTPSVGNFGIAKLLGKGQWTLGSPYLGIVPNVYIHDIQHLASFWMDPTYLRSLQNESARLVQEVARHSQEASTFGRPLEMRYNWVLEQLVVFRPQHRLKTPPVVKTWPLEIQKAWTSPELVTASELRELLSRWNEAQLRSFGQQLHLNLGHWIQPLGGAVADDLSFRFESSILGSRAYSSRLDFFADLWGNLSLAVAEGQQNELQRHVANMLAFLIELKRWNAEELVESALQNPKAKTQAFERLLHKTQVAAGEWPRYEMP
jgi:hypothetical protein